MTDTDLFSFEHRGNTYTFEKPFSTIRSPRWLRANRRRDELDLAFTILEELAGEGVLEVIDSMSEEEFKELSGRLLKDLGASFR